MSTFDEKRDEYLVKLLNHLDVMSKLLEGSEDKNAKMRKLFLSPSNEKELRIADSLLTTTIDMKELIDAAMCGNVEEIPVEENEGVKFIVDTVEVIADAKNSKVELDALSLEKLLESKIGNISTEAFAKITYDLMVGLIAQTEEVTDYLEEHVYSLIDSDSFEETAAYLEKVKATLAKKQPSSEASPEMSEEAVEGLENYVNSFHSLCERGIKKDNSIGAILMKLFERLQSNDDDDDEDDF